MEHSPVSFLLLDQFLFSGSCCFACCSVGDTLQCIVKFILSLVTSRPLGASRSICVPVRVAWRNYATAATLARKFANWRCPKPGRDPGHTISCRASFDQTVRVPTSGDHGTGTSAVRVSVK